MSLVRHLFRPAQGQTLASYTAAVADAAMYPGDWVMLSTIAPSSQGVSGVMFGKTLAATDYLECTSLLTTNLGCGTLALGVVMGKAVGSVKAWTDVSGDVLADQDVAIIQNWGIHPNASGADTAVLGDYLQASSVAYEPVNGVSGTVTGSLRPLGVCMATAATYKRVTAADTEGCVTFVHCR